MKQLVVVFSIVLWVNAFAQKPVINPEPYYEVISKIDVSPNAHLIVKNVNRTIFRGDLQMPVEHMKYYAHRNNAEKHFLAGHYVESIKEYGEAFKYKKPFFKDFYNAWTVITNYKVADSTAFLNILYGSNRFHGDNYYYLRKLNYLVSTDSFFDISYLHRFKSDSFLLPRIPDNEKKVVDSALVKRIAAMTASDQSVRKKRTPRGGIRQADSINRIEVINLFNEFDEISERTCGPAVWNDFNVILLHLTRYDYPDVLRHLYTSMIKGHFENREFACLLDSYINYNLTKQPSSLYYFTSLPSSLMNHAIIPRVDKHTINVVNERRRQIGLDDLNHQVNVLLYTIVHGYELNFYTYFTHDPSSVTPEDAIKIDNYIIERANKENPFGIIVMSKDKIIYDIDFSGR